MPSSGRPGFPGLEDARLNVVESRLERLFGTYGPSVLDCPEL
jgi:hypothetical protein